MLLLFLYIPTGERSCHEYSGHGSNYISSARVFSLYSFIFLSIALSLCVTSQVNLPAHLVVIKSTMHYAASMFQEYSESQILQMIGRAGRPQVSVHYLLSALWLCCHVHIYTSTLLQFDTTATAVIITRNSTKVGIIN